MADITERTVEAELRVATVAAIDDFPTESWHLGDVADALVDYHEKLLELMGNELEETPGDAQQAVYDAQEAKVTEAEQFVESTAGEDYGSSCVWAR
jgi:hypothetical protein